MCLWENSETDKGGHSSSVRGAAGTSRRWVPRARPGPTGSRTVKSDDQTGDIMATHAYNDVATTLPADTETWFTAYQHNRVAGPVVVALKDQETISGRRCHSVSRSSLCPVEHQFGQWDLHLQ